MNGPPSKAALVADALMAERARTERLTRQLADVVSEAAFIDEWLDNACTRLGQWVDDGGVVDSGLLPEVLDDLLTARRVLEVIRLRAVSA